MKLKTRILWMCFTLLILMGCGGENTPRRVGGGTLSTKIQSDTSQEVSTSTKPKSVTPEKVPLKLEDLIKEPKAKSPNIDGLRGVILPYSSSNGGPLIERDINFIMDLSNKKLYVLTDEDPKPNSNNTFTLDVDKMSIEALEDGGSLITLKALNKPDNWERAIVTAYKTYIQKDNYNDIIYVRIGENEFFASAPETGSRIAYKPITEGKKSRYQRDFSAKTPLGHYKVQNGDTVNGIARRFKISTRALINANPHLSDDQTIMQGENLRIPK